MKKHFLISVCCIVVMISLLLSSPAVLNARAEKLKYKDKELPVAINFPMQVKADYKKVLFPDDSDPLDSYIFTADDKVSHQNYTVSIIYFPKSWGNITTQNEQKVLVRSMAAMIGEMNVALGGVNGR